MAVKILSRSGVSLADTYDVVGSIAGVEELDSESVKVVHEMGGTIFAERFSTTVRRVVTGDILQSADFNAFISDLPGTPIRILNVTVLNLGNDSVARVSRVSAWMRDPVAGRESPLWVWGGGVTVQNVVDNNAAVTNIEVLEPAPEFTVLPLIAAGGLQPQSVSDLVLRGRTLAFGAGNLELTLLVYIAFSDPQGLSSFGLPVPSW